MGGRIERLFIKKARGSPMAELAEARAVAGKGLEGDASFGSDDRQVLLMESETLDRFGIAPGIARENLLVSGLRLADLRAGARLRIGGTVILEVTGDCEPCEFMDELRQGLRQEIQGERGILARVVDGGRIRPGDAVRPEAPDRPD
jgi:MOSC domain-containing protein YiiM